LNQLNSNPGRAVVRAELRAVLKREGEATTETLAILQKHDVLDMKTFLLMDKSDLAELFPLMGPRLRLWHVIQAERMRAVQGK
jgi:hypothetical protein